MQHFSTLWQQVMKFQAAEIQREEDVGDGHGT
jgi:hypothetical protein